MSKKILIVFIALTSSLFSLAQSHKIVFDLNSGDTSTQSKVLRQFGNVLKEAPDAQLEVVCHGAAVYMLVKGKAIFENQMKELQSRATVSFKVCANSMRRLGVDKSQLIGLAEVVPVAILELSSKQQQGWSYIWGGE